jgi:hypothetical protein
MASIRVRNILNRKHMVVSIVKPKSMLQLCRKCFQSGLHTTLECRDTKLWPISGCITISLPWRAEPTNKSLNKKNVKTLEHIWNTGEERHVTSESSCSESAFGDCVIFAAVRSYEAQISRRNNKPKPQRLIRENREGAAMKAAFWITLAIYRLPTTMFASMDEPEKIIHIQLLSAR